LSTLETAEEPPEPVGRKRRLRWVRHTVIIVVVGVTTGITVTTTSGVGAGVVAGVGTAAAVKALLGD
jgi:hypothetical protein